jgi:hypothetical protein
MKTLLKLGQSWLWIMKLSYRASGMIAAAVLCEAAPGGL